MVAFPDVLPCFLLRGLAYICVVYWLFIVAISSMYRRFVIRTRVSDNILDLYGLLIALATLDALYLIMSVMVSLVVLMSSTSCSASTRLVNSSCNSIFFDPVRVISTVGGLVAIICFLSTSTSS